MDTKWHINDAPQAGVLVGLLLGALLVLFVVAAALVAAPGARLLVGLQPLAPVTSESSSSKPLPTPSPPADLTFLP